MATSPPTGSPDESAETSDSAAEEEHAPLEEAGFGLDDLHAAIRDAALEPWSRDDYAGAVRSAQFALRDLLRAQLRRPDLDGVDLVHAIGEDRANVALPLTDLVTTTDWNIHRGVVNFLRGIVYYVRNPDAHEGSSLVPGDKVGAMERLCTMSLCARHVSEAVIPTAVDEALDELLQEGFPAEPRAFAELVGEIPVRRLGELADKTLEKAEEKYAAGDDVAFYKLRRVLREVFSSGGWDDALTATTRRRLNAWISKDDTLYLAVKLLPGQFYKSLSIRNQAKVARALAQQAARGEEKKDDATDLRGELSDLYQWLPKASQARVITAFEGGLRKGDKASPWVLFAVLEVGRYMSRAEIRGISKAVAEGVAEKSSTDLDKYVVQLSRKRSSNFTPPGFRGAGMGALREYDGQTVPGAKGVQECLTALRKR